MEDYIDKNILIKALDNDENEKMLHLTSEKIMSQKNDILQKMQIKGQELKNYHKKLKNYRLVETIDDITEDQTLSLDALSSFSTVNLPCTDSDNLSKFLQNLSIAETLSPYTPLQ